MITKPRIVKILIAGLCALFFPVISAPVATANGCSAYQIAYQGPLSGPEASTGIAQSSAVKLAISKFKAANPSAPVSAELFLADDQGDPALSQNAANSIINQSCVLAVVGPAYSGASRIALPLYKAAAVPVITPTAINESLNQYAGGTFFRSARLQKDINIDIIRDVAAISPSATIAYFNSDDSYSANWITTGFLGIQVLRSSLATEQRIDNANAIKDAYDAGARYFFYDGSKSTQEILNFAEDVKALSASNQIIFSGDFDPLLLKAMYTIALNGAWIYPTSVPVSVLNPTLASEFKSAFPTAPDLYFPESYDAAYFLLQAIASGATNRSQVSSFFLTKKMAGLAGNLEFGSIGDRDNYKTIRLLLSNGNLSIPDSSNLGLNGNFQISNRVTTTNFKFNVQDWNDASVTTNRHVIYSSHVQNIESSLVSNLYLPNGETSIEILPTSDSQDALKRRAIVKVTVTAGVVTDVRDVTNPSSPIVYSITGDTYLLKLGGFNFVGTITDSGDFTGSTAVISTVQGSTVTAVYKIPIVSSNKIFANLDISKTYQIEIYPNGNKYQYHWKTTWSNLTFGGNQTLSYSAGLLASNIFGKVTALPASGGSIRVLKKDSSNNWVTDFTRSIASTRDFGFYVAPGTEYKVEAIPNTNSVGPILTSTLTAPVTGTVTLADLTFTPANVSGSVKSGTVKFANIRVYFYRVDDDSEAFNGSTDSNGNYSAYLSPGKYYVYAESPNNLYYLKKSIYCTVESNNVNLVCDIDLIKKNASGRVTVGGVGYKSYVSVYKFDNSDGNYGMWNDTYTEENGEFAFNLPAGSYRFFAQRVITLDNGNQEFSPIGFGDLCQVTTSETTCNLSLTPNFKVNLADSSNAPLNTSGSLTFFIPIEESGVVLENFYESFWQTQNRFSADGLALPNGTHYVSVSNGGSYGEFTTRMSYKVTVTAGAVTSVTDLSGVAIAPLNGIYTLKASASNFRVKTFNGSIAFNQAQINLSSRSGKGKSRYWTGDTNTFDFKLPQGIYDLTLRPRGDEDPPRGTGKYVVSVDAQGVASMTNQAGQSVAPQGAFFEISLGDPNLTGLVTVDGVTSSASIQWQKLNSNGQWDWTDNYVEVQRNGKFGGSFEPGKYRPIVYAYSDYSSRTLLGAECVVPTSGAVVCDISIGAENLKFRIKDSENVVQTQIYTQIAAIFGANSSIQFGIGRPNRQTGITGATFLNGKYELLIYQDKNQSSKKFTFEVVNGAVQNFVDTVSKQAVNATNGVFELVFQAPQVKGVVQDSLGNQLAMAGKGLSIGLQKEVNPGQWNYYRNYWVSDPNFELRVDEEGTYRVLVDPYDFENYSRTYSATFYINSNLEVSLTNGSGYVPQLTDLNVRLKGNNFNFQVLNPIDEKPLIAGYVQVYKQTQGGSETYYSDRYVSAQSQAISGQYLEPGDYRVVVGAYNSSLLDSREYSATVNSSEEVSVSNGATALTKVDGRFVLKPHKANVFGRLYNSTGNVVSGNSGYVYVQLQQKISGIWNYLGNSTQMNRDGYFGLRVTEPGTYRLVAQPYEKDDVGLTFSSEFEITTENAATFSKEFANFTMNAPNLKITIGISESSTALVGAGVSIFRSDSKNDNLWWNHWYNTSSSGVLSTYLPYAGNYQINVGPNQEAALLGATAKRYNAIASEGTDGKISVVITPGVGVSTNAGVTRLQLGVANIRGTVTRPSDSEGVANTYVIPIKIENGNQIELWELGTSTDSDGKFSLTLPEGVYKVRARAPWQSLDYGDSKIIGDITVDSSGTVASVPTGKQALSFAIPLSLPTWSGVIKNPSGTAVVPNSNLCLNYRVSSNSYASTCSYTDSLGRFALTLPDGSTLDSGSSLQMYSPNNIFPSRNLTGQIAIETFLGSPGSGKELLFPSANVKINVTGDGVAIPEVEVQVLQDGRWLGSQSTNNIGVAEFYSTAPTAALLAQTWLGNSASALNARYVSTKRDFSASEVAAGTSNNIFTGTVALATPNIKGVVRLPSVNGVQGAISNRASINVYDREKGDWVSWANPAEDGTFALFLKGGCCESKSYTLVLEPYWDLASTQELVRKEFDVTVSTTNVATITDRSTGLAIATESLSSVLVSTFVMGTPNIVGSVVNPSGTKVSNVGVEIYGQEFTYGTYSNQNGDFKESLPNGTYTAQAGMWGNNTGFAPSARCQIEIAQNQVKTPGEGCVNSDGTLRLALRAANFTFTLKNSGTPITNANVYLNIGGWGTHAYPDSTGKVTFFVDDVAIAAQSQNEKYGTNTFTPRIYVYPYGQTNGVIQWSCNAGDSKPICSQLGTYTIGTPWADKLLGDIQVLTSNIKIKIVRPVGTESIGEHAYAEIIRIDRGYDEWAGWGRTDSDGFAGFYIETSTALVGARYKIRVNPPWHLRSTYTAKVWDNSTNGYTYDQLNNLQLALGTPNLKVSVVSPNGSTPNKWGWAYIEEVNSSNASIKWVDSTGLDEHGKTAYILEASKRYRLVAYPAGGRSGSVTSCLIQSDSATALTFVSGGCVGGTFNTTSEMTLVLARGNVIGTVYSTDGTTPVAGAIIYANIVGAADEKMAVTSCTLANGTYGITLDPNYQWNVKVFPVNIPGAAVQLANKTDLAAITPPQIGESTTMNVTLSAKP